MHLLSNASPNEIKWTLPALIGAVLFAWRVVTRARDYWRLTHPRVQSVERRDLSGYKIYAIGGIVVTGLLLIAEIWFVIPGLIAMTIPNPPTTPSPTGNLLINGLLAAQACLMLVAIADRVFHRWLTDATRRWQVRRRQREKKI